MGFFDGDSELVHQTIFPIRNMPSIDVQTGVLRCVFSSLVKVSGVRSIALPRSNRAQTRHINCRKPKSMKHRWRIHENSFDGIVGTVLLLEQLARLAKRIPSGLCAKVSSWTQSQWLLHCVRNREIADWMTSKSLRVIESSCSGQICHMHWWLVLSQGAAIHCLIASSGLGSAIKARMDSKHLKTLSEGLHESFRISRPQSAFKRLVLPLCSSFSNCADAQVRSKHSRNVVEFPQAQAEGKAPIQKESEIQRWSCTRQSTSKINAKPRALSKAQMAPFVFTLQW